MPKNKRIHKKLLDLDLTITELARRLGLSRQHLSAVVSGRISSSRARVMIAAALGESPDKLWPKRRPMKRSILNVRSDRKSKESNG